MAITQDKTGVTELVASPTAVAKNLLKAKQAFKTDRKNTILNEITENN
ncbi:hypothetical protein JOD55_000219 [Arcanobacterium pluranimalium]|nr:hypothetical protein [Arcanobacterium pluranimalium]MBM7824392.1 hypothetical protein [Arcanobacterium pluranimalium]